MDILLLGGADVNRGRGGCGLHVFAGSEHLGPSLLLLWAALVHCAAQNGSAALAKSSLVRC